ncbi:MAG: DUF2399 domain-containing protein [Clostridia bacterium]|nr:DUF2399 domain-containing protein [Clostridia bacterium]
MKNYENVLLNKLVDKYEKSKSFSGNNLVKQSFTLKITELFPKYSDDAEYELFRDVNEAIDKLAERGFVSYKKQKNAVVTSVSLELQSLNAVYLFLKRTPKKDVNEKIRGLLQKYRNSNEILKKYCDTQLQRITENKPVKFFEDLTSFENILKSLAEVLNIQTEIFQRDFSARVLGDSKAFEKVKSKVVAILYEYGDFPNSETVLEDLNIIRNPGHVYFKGNGEITIGEQHIDFSGLDGDLAISSSLLSAIKEIKVTGDAVITIENLTTFNSFKSDNAFILYLGGYHNTDRRNFIKKLYEQNPTKCYYHYGDIDAGGFYILLHLRKKTGVNFLPYHMDIETLKKYCFCAKNLTENDRKRLEKLMDSEFHDVITYMIENNCKLEQEVLD